MRTSMVNGRFVVPGFFALSMILGSSPAQGQDGTFCATLKNVPPSTTNTGAMECECGEDSSVDWSQLTINIQNAQIGPVGVSGKIGVGGSGGSGSGGGGSDQGGDSTCWAITIVTPSHREAVTPGPLLVKEVGKLQETVILRECDKSDCSTFLFFFDTGDAQCKVVRVVKMNSDLPIYQVVGSCVPPPDGSGNGAGPSTPPPSGGKGPKTGGGGGAKGPTTGGGSNGPTTPGGEG